jgi:hypothetical protein
MNVTISSTLATDSQEVSGESQPVTPRIKKQSRYPCRRAQRPVKLVDSSQTMNVNE